MRVIGEARVADEGLEEDSAEEQAQERHTGALLREGMREV